jgi:hypothetical protein
MKAFAKLVLALSVVTLWPLTAEFGVPGSGVSAAEEEKEMKTRRVPPINEATYKKLAEAQAFMDLKEYASAKAVIDDTIESRLKRMIGNEEWQFYHMLGYIAFSQEDFKGAINSYEKVFDQGDEIPEGLEVSTLYTLAQLHFV